MSAHNLNQSFKTEWAVGLGQGVREGQRWPVGKPQSVETANLESERLASLVFSLYVHDLQPTDVCQGAGPTQGSLGP